MKKPTNTADSRRMTARLNRLLSRQAVLAWAMLTCAGCASLPPEAANFNNFSEYAEAVFKHQNQVISRMMMLNDNEQLPDNDDLDNREEAMHDACHLLNEYAEKEIDGEFISPFFTNTVRNSIESCDHSIRSLEQLIEQLIPAIDPATPKAANAL